MVNRNLIRGLEPSKEEWERELEAAMDGTDAAIVLCDRGTPDGLAYWPGPDTLWASLGTTLEAQLQRYDAVIHLRTPRLEQGYNHQNPLRTESAEQAAVIDARIAQAWASHPRRFVIESTPDFLTKAAETIRIVGLEMPACCRGRKTSCRRQGPAPARRPR